MKCFNSGNSLIPWVTGAIYSQPEPLWQSKLASSASWRLARVGLNSSIGGSDFKVRCCSNCSLCACLSLSLGPILSSRFAQRPLLVLAIASISQILRQARCTASGKPSVHSPNSRPKNFLANRNHFGHLRTQPLLLLPPHGERPQWI